MRGQVFTCRENMGLGIGPNFSWAERIASQTHTVLPEAGVKA